MFQHILAATDLIAEIDAPVVSAARLARHTGAWLHLVHVIETAHPGPGDDRPLRQDAKHASAPTDDAIAAEIRKVLQGNYASCVADLPHQIIVAEGIPWQTILNAAKETSADLIVLGPHSTQAEAKGIERRVGRVGSTAGEVIAHESCPVMVVNRPSDETQLAFRKILVGVDFSASCECAVCFAARIASRCGSIVTVFHMLPVPPYPKYTQRDRDADIASAGNRLNVLCEPYLAGIATDYRIQPGALPHLELLNAAEACQADLIVMGSHTKEAAGKWYPGSAVERVSYRARCPVMVITDPDVLVPGEEPKPSAVSNHRDRLIHIFTDPEPRSACR